MGEFMPHTNPSTFVLVHGAWSGGWCYARVAALLRARGHTVFTPTLTGQGERAHLLSGAINLSTHIEDILGVFRCERLSDVVLGGHSYGGMVITGVADRIPEKIKALAYLDAFVPQDGQSLFDINIPANTQRFLDNAGATGGLSVPAPPASYFGVNAADAATVDALATPHPLGCFTEKLKLTGAYRAVKTHLYVHGTVLPRESPFRPFYERALAAGWSARSLACGHDVMLDMPEQTAELLESVV
jgi:pimeloyl-ACP methyl ester carboxylesterase